MKISFNQKIISTFIFFSIAFSLFSFPQKTNAIFGAGDTVIEVGQNLVVNSTTAANTSALAVSAQLSHVREYVLNGLAYGFAKQIIRQLTYSVVSWINSGFQGSPAFLQNPGAFFLDVADQITGDFLAKHGGPLNDLCSPFSIDIRLALAFKYRPNVPKRYTCTLGKIIGNTKNAVENASINGFTAGDFKQGGWPAFVSLTTEPQNNVYGAYLQADAELSWRVANAQSQQREEINAGKGFLSWRNKKCMDDPVKYNQSIQDRREASESQAEGSVKYVKKVATRQDCPIETPGSTISSSLENHLGGPLRELELADSINEITNALFAQLVTQVLQKGLAGSSSKGSDGQSYLDSTIADIESEKNPQFISVKNQLIDTVKGNKQNSFTLRQNRDEAVKVMGNVKATFDQARTCYAAKLDTANKNKYTGAVQIAQTAITDIDSTLLRSVTPRLLELFKLSEEANSELNTLNTIEAQANAAKTLGDLKGPSNTLNKLLQDEGLSGAEDLSKSIVDLTNVKDESVPLLQDAQRKLQMCQILN